jgi:ribosomal protein L23
MLEPTDDTKDFFARRIQTWYRHQRKQWYASHEKPKSFYVLKEKSGYRLLTKEEVVKEHVASVLYRLFGIRTPEIRIVRYEEEPERVGIASQYIRGYKDLYKVLQVSSENGAQQLIDRLDKESDQTKRNVLFQEHVKGIHLGSRESLLVAAVCLMDPDVIGVGFSNMGYVCDGVDQKNHIVKIDPGCIDFKSDINQFIKDVSLVNEALLSDFSSKVYNDPKFERVGDMHLLEFFSGLDRLELIKNINALAVISDDEIRRHVIRPDYQLLIEPAILEKIAGSIIARKAHLLSLVESFEKKPFDKTLSLQPVFTDSTSFSEPVHTINRGNAHPVIVYKKEDDEVRSRCYYSL